MSRSMTSAIPAVVKSDGPDQAAAPPQRRDLKPSQYIEAKTFLASLEDANEALQQPDAAKLFSAHYNLSAKTVPELVNFMTDNGLRFAAAVPGDEGAYAALHHALAAFDRAVQVQTVARAAR